jgi:hypothetical protein
MSNALDLLCARAKVRTHLGAAHADAGRMKREANAALHAAFAAFQSALAEHVAAGEADEGHRTRVRSLASELAAAHVGVARADEEERRCLAELQAADIGIATASRELHDPELLRRSSPATAMALWSEEDAMQAADGLIELQEVKLRQAGRAGIIAAEQELNASGARVSSIAWTVYMVPPLIAFAKRGIEAVSNPWHADELPNPDKAGQIVEWVRAKADLPTSPRAASLLQMLRRIEAAVREGVRDSNGFEQWARSQSGGAVPRMAEPPPPPGRRLESPDGTHYPAGRSPAATGPHTITRPTTAAVHAATATATAEEGEVEELGRPAVPAFLSDFPGVDRHLTR